MSTTETNANIAATTTFGKVPTDHMFIAEYKNGKWNEGTLTRFQHISLSPFALCFHYGQTVFEGMKAFRMKDGQVNVFRPLKNFERMNLSLERMCMPPLSEELFMHGVSEMVKADKKFIDEDEESSLYIRPLVIATEERIGVKVSDEYLFIVMCSPAKKYFANPIKVKVETEFTRAAEGGTGFAKCGGNYGAAYYPTHLAHLQGYDQVIWTDGQNHEYMEESGTMNVIFVVDGTLITPALSGTILEGITRDSILTLARKNGMKVEERRVSVKEIQDAFESGKKVEACGVGTVAVVAPIEQIDINGKKYTPFTGDNSQMAKMKRQLLEIRLGIQKDENGWNYMVK
ncbi:MAG: branched-chain amino acid aminotransferase [Bacteroidetes bacterium]|nr:branched-chain amino acid aminotransferase [Bacteroidota bacterium]